MLESNLKEEIRKGRVILFVGAGVSASLNVPTWKELIDHMAGELGYDPDIFHASSSNYLTLAEYYRIQKDSIGPLRSWMDSNWQVSDDILSKSEIHNLIVSLKFPLIYTTNYDRFLEKCYTLQGRKFDRIANVRDIVNATEGTPQIVKLHGDFDNDSSIVLTETHYFERLSFEAPLDLKLRSDALGKSLLFIGYSLSDINIRFLLYKLSKMWKDSGLQKHQPISYLFQPKPDPIQEKVLGEWGIRIVTEDVNDPRKALTRFLQGLTS